MRKTYLLILGFCFVPLFLMGQVLNSFDTQVDTVWFKMYKGDTAGDTSKIIQTVDTQNQIEGAGCIRMEYIAQNSEDWGGFVKLEHMKQEAGSYDWSAYDSVSFWYNNLVKQDLPGRVHLRFNLSDNSDVADTLTDAGKMEFYYSFHYILDNDPGWHEIKIPLIDGRGNPAVDEWNGFAFNRTGWNGPPGNDILDKDKIKGFAFEFSISTGTVGGSDDISQGVILIDDLRLKGSLNKLTDNNGFEDGLTGWDFAQGGGYRELRTEGAYAGSNFLEIGVNDNSWAISYFDSIEAQAGATYELSAFIKDLSATELGASFAALKLEAHRADNSEIIHWEDNIPDVTRDWQQHSISHIMPQETSFITVGLVATKWSGDGATAAYGFDNITLLDKGVADTTDPEAPTGVLATADAPNYNNLINWQDVPGETGETYSIYASTSPITNVDDPGIELVASGVAEDVNEFVHYLYWPLHNKDLTYYYAVTCTDESANTGPAGMAGSGTVNTAKGVPTISLNVPANFAADGDFTEWDNAGIMPFEMSPETHNVSVGTITDAADLSAKIYLAIDDDFLYIAADVIDDVYNWGAGNWWDQDVFQFFIGLYDSRSGKHKVYKTGAEPDYIMYFNEEKIRWDTEQKDLYLPTSDNYYFGSFNPDYAFEAKISLDSIALDTENRFHPQRGMRIPFDLYFHDNDGSWEGNLAYSPLNTDHAHETPQEWGYTWIGDTNVVISAINDKPGFVAGSYELRQNYPNPFNPSTTIEYTLAKASNVKITIFNLLGQEVDVLVNTKKAAGTYQAKFNGANYTSGVYFYKIEAGNYTKVRKMLMVK